MNQSVIANEAIKDQLHGEAVLLAKTSERLQQAVAFEQADKRYMRMYETTHVGGRVTHNVEFGDVMEELNGAFPVEETQVFTWNYVFEWDLGINLVSRHLVE